MKNLIEFPYKRFLCIRKSDFSCVVIYRAPTITRKLGPAKVTLVQFILIRTGKKKSTCE